MALPMIEAMVPARTVFAKTAAGKVRVAAIEMVHGSAGATKFGLQKNLWSPAAVGTGFDLSPTAIRRAQELHPDSNVEYVTADLLRLPSDWRHAFDLVVEVWTVQALPDPPRTQAIEAIASLVAPQGDLVVIAIARDDDGPDHRPGDGPPWFLNRNTINKFDTLTGLTTRDIHLGPDPEAPDRRQSWTAHFTRS